MGLLMIEVAEPVPIQCSALSKTKNTVIPAINPATMDSRVLNPLFPLLDDSKMALVRS